jgi:Tol biopolymer transport system component
MKADGSGRETLLNHWGSPRWMQDGNRIAQIGSNGGISIFDLADGKERAILSGPSFLRPGFAISADGRNFVFGKNDGGLYLASLDPRTMRSSVTTLWTLGVCYHASWSPDGKRIVFGWKPDPPKNLTQGIGLHQLFVVDIDSNELPVPLPGQNPERNNTNPDWSPDGKTIIFASQLPQ